eukprot:2725208-Pleurochrysis_carterae.AAC.1
MEEGVRMRQQRERCAEWRRRRGDGSLTGKRQCAGQRSSPPRDSSPKKTRSCAAVRDVEPLCNTHAHTDTRPLQRPSSDTAICSSTTYAQSAPRVFDRGAATCQALNERW